MKNFLYFLLFTSCLGFSQSQINLEKSSVKWTGTQISGKSHYGTLSFKSADLKLEDGELTGASFVVDMTTLTVDDLSGKSKKSLEGHLASDDFFSVSEYQTSDLVLDKVSKTAENKYLASGKLTIKGATHAAEITFSRDQDLNRMTAKLVFDRSKYDVRYGSGSFFENLGDRLILDDIELEVTIKMM